MSDTVSHDWIGWSIGLVGVVLAAVFYFKSKTTTKLVYQWNSRYLVGGDAADLPDEVTISYKGIAVPRLSSTDIIFWNAGNLTIRDSDIVNADPLRIVLSEEAKILRTLVTVATRKVNQFVVRVHPERPNEAFCTFDYLDPGDGVRVEILHTSEKGRPDLRGTVRGLQRGVSAWGKIRTSSDDVSLSVRQIYSRLYVITPYLVSITGGALLVLILFAEMIQIRYPKMAFWVPKHRLGQIDVIAAAVTSLTYIVPGSFLIWARRKRFPKALSNDE